MSVALLIAVLAMVLVGLRPKGIPEWVWAIAGAISLLVFGFEPTASALRAIGDQWNVLLFILGLMGISAGAECSGLFEWVADVVLERAGGSRRRLFVAIFLSGGMLTVLLSIIPMYLIFFTSFISTQLNGVFLFTIAWLISAVAAVVLPFRRKAMFQMSDARSKFLGFPAQIGRAHV